MFVFMAAASLLLVPAVRAHSQQPFSNASVRHTQNLSGGQPLLPGYFGQTPTLDSLLDLADQGPVEKLNSARQKSMKADVEQLLKLSGELNADLGDPVNALRSPKDLKKVEEIRKLARNVKESMGMAPYAR
jgi:hypothetical protein